MPSSPGDRDPSPFAEDETDRLPAQSRHRAPPARWWRGWPVAVGVALVVGTAGLAVAASPRADEHRVAAAPLPAEESAEPRPRVPAPAWRTAAPSSAVPAAGPADGSTSGAPSAAPVAPPATSGASSAVPSPAAAPSPAPP